MLTILAPAKLNLTLEVLAKRTDGYHEIRSVIQTINLGDSLSFQLSQEVTFKSNSPDWTPEKSLVSKAVSLLQETTGCSKGVAVEVDKRIPLMSGLGGDSSDAAVTLRGLNKLWELDLSHSKLLELAMHLGSDVAFFLYGGTALVEGRGERVTPLPLFPHTWIVLLVPDVPRPLRKTAQLYASLKTRHYTNGQATERLVAALREGREPIPSLLFNTFENVAFTHFPQLKARRQQLLKAGADNVHLDGAGPVLFTLIKDKVQAEGLYICLEKQGLEVYLTNTLATID